MNAVYHVSSYGRQAFRVVIGKGGDRLYQDKEQNIAAALNQVREEGISLFLEGKPSDPETIAERFVREEEAYMADYVLDDAGRLKELRYDKVRNL